MEANSMSDELFSQLLSLHMQNDPAGTFPIDHQLLGNELRMEAENRGFRDWVEAYHVMGA